MLRTHLQTSSTFRLKTKFMMTLFNALQGNWDDQHLQQCRESHDSWPTRAQHAGETPRSQRRETLRVSTAKMFIGSRRCEFTPGSHRRKRISFDVSPRVGLHSDTNSEDDEDTSSKSLRQTKSGTTSRICQRGANLKVAQQQMSYTKRTKKTSAQFATLME